MSLAFDLEDLPPAEGASAPRKTGSIFLKIRKSTKKRKGGLEECGRRMAISAVAKSEKNN